ncbi:MAG: beta strand repeat-containing protein, partial [Rhodospirillales bacterium]
ATGDHGAGGTVILWADRDTLALGSVSALPGLVSGQGGFVEISAGETLSRFDGTVTASRPGRPGTVLFDPKNIVISTTAAGTFQYGLVIGKGYSPGRNIDVSDLDSNDDFGSAVAMNADGTRLAVGAAGDGGAGSVALGSGAVHLFTFTDGSFGGGALAGIVGKGYTGGNNVDVSLLSSYDNFGQAIALSADGRTMAVGAPGDDGAANLTSNAGAVHLITFDDGSFGGGALVGTIGHGYTGTKSLDLSASLNSADSFGAVALSANGRLLAVGAVGDDGPTNATTNRGAVHLITFADGSFTGGVLAGTIGRGYTLGKNLDVASLQSDDQFGGSVALNAAGDRLAVGAWADDANANAYLNSGAVFLFSFTDTAFSGAALQGTIGRGYSGGKNVNVTLLAEDDRFGRSVALSADGSRLAVGAQWDTGSSGTVTNSGAVHLFTFNDTTFGGGALAGTVGRGYTGGKNVDVAVEDYDTFGTAVALTAAGTRLVVGAPSDDGAGNIFGDSGAVHLFSFTDGAFTGGQLVGTIGRGYVATTPGLGVPALENDDNFGIAVALSADGMRLAVGANNDDGAGNVATGSGAVRLFTFSDGAFGGGQLVGTIGKGYTGVGNIDVEALEASDLFGESVALSADATKLAVGAIGDDGNSNSFSESGAVYLFTFTDTAFGGGTLQATIGKSYGSGKNINLGLQADDVLGRSVALSADGSRLAAGASGNDGSGNVASNSGAVYLFSFSAADFGGGVLEATVGKGYTGGKNVDVAALGAGDQFGISVALSADGTRLAVGAHLDDGNGNTSSDSGAVRLFTFTDAAFGGGNLKATIGYGYSGDNNVDVGSLDPSDQFGRSVALSADGRRLAVGVRGDDGATNATSGAGAVRLFTFTDASFGGGQLVGTIGKGYVGGRNVDVPGIEANDAFGWSVALNGDGTRLAVGAIFADGNANTASNSGEVYLFRENADSLAGNLFGDNASGTATFSPATLTALLNAGNAVTLQANNDITVSDPIVVVPSGAAGGALTLQAGRSILIDANITTGNGALTLTANDPGAVAGQRDEGPGGITMAAGTAIDTGTGAFTATAAGSGEVGPIT